MTVSKGYVNVHEHVVYQTGIKKTTLRNMGEITHQTFPTTCANTQGDTRSTSAFSSAPSPPHQSRHNGKKHHIFAGGIPGYSAEMRKEELSTSSEERAAINTSIASTQPQLVLLTGRSSWSNTVPPPWGWFHVIYTTSAGRRWWRQ